LGWHSAQGLGRLAPPSDQIGLTGPATRRGTGARPGRSPRAVRWRWHDGCWWLGRRGVNTRALFVYGYK
jgi:hypothetical protein